MLVGSNSAIEGRTPLRFAHGDARSMGEDVRAQNAERAHAATARRVKRQVGEVREALSKLQVRDEAGQALFLRYEPCPVQTVVQFQGPVLEREVTLQLRREEHVWLSGPNGRGKTTLLRAALAQCRVPEERTLVLPQELTVQESEADLSTLRELPQDERGRVLLAQRRDRRVPVGRAEHADLLVERLAPIAALRCRRAARARCRCRPGRWGRSSAGRRCPCPRRRALPCRRCAR